MYDCAVCVLLQNILKNGKWYILGTYVEFCIESCIIQGRKCKKFIKIGHRFVDNQQDFSIFISNGKYLPTFFVKKATDVEKSYRYTLLT